MKGKRIEEGKGWDEGREQLEERMSDQGEMNVGKEEGIGKGN